MTLIVAAQQGDEAASSVLVSRYRGFVRCKARSYFLAGADRDDVVQEGMIGLYKAIRDYDPARQASFRSFAELCITRQLITAIKSATRQKHSPLNSYVQRHESNHLRLGRNRRGQIVPAQAHYRRAGAARQLGVTNAFS
jgi:RNA polymerase sigma-H factor